MPRDAILCPLEHKPVIDPVIDHDGHSYSGLAIRAWIDEFGTSPVTGLPLSHAQTAPWHLVSASNPPSKHDTAVHFRRVSSVLTPSPEQPPKRSNKRKRLCFKSKPRTTWSGAQPASVGPYNLQSCGRPSCLWCPQCALCAFSKAAHPGLWPPDIYNAVFPAATPPPTFDHKMRVRAGMFFYANLAYQSKEMFWNLMKPRLSRHVSRKDIDFLFSTCERKFTNYSTNDANLGNDRVLMNGKPAPLTSSAGSAAIAARKSTTFESYIAQAMEKSLPMPDYRTTQSFFCTTNTCPDARVFFRVHHSTE